MHVCIHDASSSLICRNSLHACRLARTDMSAGCNRVGTCMWLIERLYIPDHIAAPHAHTCALVIPSSAEYKKNAVTVGFEPRTSRPTSNLSTACTKPVRLWFKLEFTLWPYRVGMNHSYFLLTLEPVRIGMIHTTRNMAPITSELEKIAIELGP